MRSFMTTVALAAFFVSAPLVSALAAPSHSMHELKPTFGNGGDTPDSPAPSYGYAPGGQLRAILDDLQGYDARIMSDRRARLITPAEVRSLRGEEAMIRRAAVRDSARDGGKIPAGAYDQLMAQVDDLGLQIGRDAALR